MIDTAATQSTQPVSRAVGALLQLTLVELVELGLDAKQAHWNVVGSEFRSIHLELDEIAELARRASDEVAERMAALGTPPDGRPATITVKAPVDPLPGGWIRDRTVLELMSARLDRVCRANRARLGDVAEADPISEAVLTDVLADLEKAAWMLRAQLA